MIIYHCLHISRKKRTQASRLPREVHEPSHALFCRPRKPSTVGRITREPYYTGRHQGKTGSNNSNTTNKTPERNTQAWNRTHPYSRTHPHTKGAACSTRQGTHSSSEEKEQTQNKTKLRRAPSCDPSKAPAPLGSKKRECTSDSLSEPLRLRTKYFDATEAPCSEKARGDRTQQIRPASPQFGVGKTNVLCTGSKAAPAAKKAASRTTSRAQDERGRQDSKNNGENNTIDHVADSKTREQRPAIKTRELY